MWRKIWQNKLNLLWIIGILIRVFGIFQYGQPYDMGTYQAWGEAIVYQGAGSLYSKMWCDYLPLPTHLFAAIAQLALSTSLPYSLTFKLTTSLLEVGLLVWLFRLIKSPRSRLLLPLLVLSPALIGNTSYWGQTDSLPALLTAISLIIFTRYLRQPSVRQLFLSTLAFTLAVAFKPIMLVALPVFVVLLFSTHPRPRLLPLIFAGLLSFFLFLLPGLTVVNNLPGSFKFLLDKTLEQASTYPYLSVNAFNLWTLHSSFTSWISDTQPVLGMTGNNFGLLLFGFLSLRLLWLWRRAKWNRRHAFRVAATLLITFYTVTTRMHERHLLFGLPFLALAALGELWLLLPFFLLTLSYSLNLYGAFYWIIHEQTWPFPLSFAHLASWLNLFIAVGLSWIWDWPKQLAIAQQHFSRHRPLLLVLSLATLLRLVNLGHPPAHIFDEVYHAFTAQELVKNNPMAWEWWNTPPEGFAYEWTHPPVAKYGMVAGLLLFGDSPFSWRFFSAIFGVVSIYGIYQLTLSLFKNKKTALLAALLLTIEGTHLVQSRIGMNDVYMLTFMIWSLHQALNNHWKKASLLFGLSLASKWSALYGLIPLSLIYLQHFRPSLKYLLQPPRYLAIATLTYAIVYAPFFLSGHDWSQFVELHRQMWYYHTHLVASHTYQSTPLEWIFSLRPVWYWVDYAKSPSYLYVQGNPLILWAGLVTVALLFRKLTSRPHRLVLTTYLAFLVPWIFSPRIMFFYHYLPSATFLTIALSDWLAKHSPRVQKIIIRLTLISFALLIPVYYGLPVANFYWDTLFTVFPTWK